MKKPNYTKLKKFQLLALPFCATGLLGIAQADEEMEWEAGEGYHEEEWYDPTDWFNEDSQISYEDDYYSGNYWDDNYAYTSSPNWNDDTWYDTYDYTYDYNYGYDYGLDDGWDYSYPTTVYTWNASDQGWAEDDNATTSNPGNNSTSEKSSKGENSKKNKSNSNDRKGTVLKGTIEGFRRMDLTTGGRKAEHTFAKLRLESGKSQVVNLGRNLTLDKIDLEKGDTIRVAGKRGSVKGRDTLVATKIKVDGKDYNVGREDRNYVLAGKIKDFTKTKMGKKGDHLMVRVDLKKGKDMLVDFGPNATLKDLDISKGDKVHINGRRAQVDGKSILVAQAISVTNTDSEEDDS